MNLDDLLSNLPDQDDNTETDARFDRYRPVASQYDSLVDKYSAIHGPNHPDLAALAKSALLKESQGNPRAQSPKGAKGLMQLMDDTYKDMGGDPKNAFIPDDNINRGVKYLARQLDKYGDPRLALAAYNAGPGNVDKYQDVPPFAETQDYVKKGSRYFERLRQPSAFEKSLDNLPDKEEPENGNDDLFANLPDQGPADESTAKEPRVNLLEGLLQGSQEEPNAANTFADNTYFAPRDVKREFELSTGEAPTIGAQLAKERGTEGKLPVPNAPEQASTTWNPVNPNFVKGFGKQAAHDLTLGSYKPTIKPEERGGATVGGVVAGVAPMAASFFPPIAPFAVPLTVAMQGLPATAGDVEQTGELKHPAQAAINIGFAAALAEMPPAVGKSIIAKIGTGAGLGELQAVVTQALTQKADGKQIDLSDPEAVKDQITQTIMGTLFGALHKSAPGEAPKTSAAIEGQTQTPLTPEKKFQMPMDNAAAISQARKQALEAGIPPEQVDAFLQTLQHKVDRGADYPLSFETKEAEKPAQPEDMEMPTIDPMPAAPHEVMPDEYLNSLQKLAPGRPASAFTPHAQLVEDALYHGEVVPEKVIKAYPHLQALKDFMDRSKTYHEKAVESDDGEIYYPDNQWQDMEDAYLRYSALSRKNSSSSSLTPFELNSNIEGTGSPVPAVDNETPPSLDETPTGALPTRQNEDLALRNTDKGISEAMPSNVSPSPSKVKTEVDEKVPSLYDQVISMARKRPIYLDAETKNQLGLSKVKYKDFQKQYGQIFTADKNKGVTLDALAERIRERGGSGLFVRGHDARNVQMNDIIEALAGGGVDEIKTNGQATPNAAFEDFLRNGAEGYDTTPTPARALGNSFEVGGVEMTRVPDTKPDEYKYQDPQGNTFTFGPDDMIHEGGKAKDSGEPPAPASDENGDILFQKPPKASQEDMFGNQGRVASQGFIKGKGEDKGLEGTPLFEGPKAEEQKKAEEDQQTLFQKNQEKEKAPIFFSQLRKTIEEKMPNAAGPEAVKGLIKANAIKEEEIKWSGLDDFLKTKEGQKISKQELLDHLDQNQVKVEEVEHGDKPKLADPPQWTHPDKFTWKSELGNIEDIPWSGFSVDLKNGQTHVAKTLEEAKQIVEDFRQNNPERKVSTRFGQYQEPGGKNYRELLLTLPGKKQAAPVGPRGWGETGNANSAAGDINFHSPHFDELNILAHVRFNDRTTPEGKKVLHLEEVQSDWHQAGRKKGYTDPKRLERDKRRDELHAKGANQTEAENKEWLDLLFYEEPGNRGQIPDAPFKKTWHEMALRRMLRYAAENGYDYLSWTGGEKQAARYDLSKQVDKIMYAEQEDVGGWFVGAYKNGREILNKDHLPLSEQELADTFGKEIAAKIVKGEGSAIPGGPEKELTGIDLKVGGEGMKGFYDKMIPQYLAKYGKKWDAKVEEIPLERDKYNLKDDDDMSATKVAEPYQGIPITDAMRKSVMEEGQPLFQKPKDDIKGSFRFDSEAKKYVITLFKGKADLSTLFHEYFHYLEQGRVINSADRAALHKALEGYGIKDAFKANGAFKPEGAERVARWFERYLRDGKTAIPELKAVFEKIKQWMREIYQSIRGTDLEPKVPPELAKTFDSILRGDSAPEAKAAPIGATAPLHQEKTPDPFSPRPFISDDATPGNKRSGFLTALEYGYSGIVNSAYPIEKIGTYFDKLTGNKDKTEEMNIKYGINRVLGSGGSANLYLGKHLEPIMQGGVVDGVKFPKLSIDEIRKVDEFALARDTVWRLDNVEGYEPTMPREVAVKVKEDLKKLPPEKRARIENAANALVQYGKKLSARKVDANIWTQADFEKITQNPYYIPQIRDFEKTTSQPLGKSKKNEFTSANKMVRGHYADESGAPLFNPIIALVHDTRQFAAEGAKMSVFNKVVDLADTNPEIKKIIYRLPEGYVLKPHEGKVPVLRNRETHLSPEQTKIAEKYENALEVLKRPQDDPHEGILRNQREKIRDQFYRGPGGKDQKASAAFEDAIAAQDRNRIAFLKRQREEAIKTQSEFHKLPMKDRVLIQNYIEEGKPQDFVVPKEIEEAVKGLGPLELAPWQKPLVMAASLFRRMQVGYNLPFTLSNTPRDLQEAYYNVGLKPWIAFKGLMHFIKKDAVYETLAREGGMMEGDESGFRQSADKSIDIRYGSGIKNTYARVRDAEAWKNKKMSAFGKEINISTLSRMAEAVKQTVKVPLNAVEWVGEAGEMMTRLGVVDAALKKGLTEEEAIHMARQATLDFKRIGNKHMRAANAMLPFLNAQIQGIDKTVRTLRDAPGKAALRLFIGTVTPAIILQAWNRRNPNYSDISAWEKNYYWIFMKDSEGKAYFKIAKGAVVKTVVNPFQMLFEKWDKTALEDGWEIAAEGIKSLTPVDNPGSLINPLLKLWPEIKANYDYYFNKDIVRSPGRPAGYQHDPGTAKTLMTIGEGLNISPEKMQHTMKSLLGGSAENLLYVTDYFLGKTKIQPPREFNANYTPMLNKFFGMTQSWQSDAAQKEREINKALKANKEGYNSMKYEYGQLSVKKDTASMNRLRAGLKKSVQEKIELKKELGAAQGAGDAASDLNAILKLRTQAPQVPSGAN